MKSTGDLLDVLKKKDSYEEIIEAEPDFFDLTLAEYLAQLIDEKKLKKAVIIAESGLERTYAYQIFSGKKLPKRDKLLALAFGMQLTYEETQTLLKVNEYAQLYPKNRRDSMIIFALNKGQSIFELNETLFSMGEHTIT